MVEEASGVTTDAVIVATRGTAPVYEHDGDGLHLVRFVRDPASSADLAECPRVVDEHGDPLRALVVRSAPIAPGVHVQLRPLALLHDLSGSPILIGAPVADERASESRSGRQAIAAGRRRPRVGVPVGRVPSLLRDARGRARRRVLRGRRGPSPAAPLRQGRAHQRPDRPRHEGPGGRAAQAHAARTQMRSVGIAQLLMQCGMFVGAESYRANVAEALFTHFKREEDPTMTSGKLDEELRRMSEIADLLPPNSTVLFNESFAATNEREGADIAESIVHALIEAGTNVFFVTHSFELANMFYRERLETALFLRAERSPDGERTFRQVEGAPLATSYGEDLYRMVFTRAPREPAP